MDQGVGRRVKELREGRGWSQAKLAVEAEMSVSGVSMIENGQRNLTTTTLGKLAKAFGVEIADLFPKGQASLLYSGQGRRFSMLAKAIVVASERWADMTAKSAADHGRASGMVTMASDLKGILETVMEEYEEAWEKVPSQEKGEITSVVAALNRVTQEYRASQEVERVADQRRAMVRQLTDELEKSA